MRHKLSLLALVSMLGVGYATATAAQPSRETMPSNAEQLDDRDDDGLNLGWLGLAGLAGLFGLKRLERDRTARPDLGHSTPAR